MAAQEQMTKKELQAVINNPVMPEFAKKHAQEALDAGNYKEAKQESKSAYQKEVERQKKTGDYVEGEGISLYSMAKNIEEKQLKEKAKKEAPKAKAERKVASGMQKPKFSEGDFVLLNIKPSKAKKWIDLASSKPNKEIEVRGKVTLVEPERIDGKNLYTVRFDKEFKDVNAAGSAWVSEEKLSLAPKKYTKKDELQEAINFFIKDGGLEKMNSADATYTNMLIKFAQNGKNVMTSQEDEALTYWNKQADNVKGDAGLALEVLIKNVKSKKPMEQPAKKLKVVKDSASDKIKECKKALEDAQYKVVKKTTASGKKQVRIKRDDNQILNTKMDSVAATIRKDVKAGSPNESEIEKSIKNIQKTLTKIVQALDKHAKEAKLEKIKKIEELLKELL